MPIITASANDLRSLIKRKLSDSELEEILPLNKIEIDSWEGDELRLEVTPDRPDLYSPEGIARQINAWLSLAPGPPGHILSKPTVKLSTEKVSSRPVIAAGIVRGLSLTDSAIKSLMQLQELLDTSIGRGRKKIATGVHDFGRIRPPLLYTERAPDSVRFIPLNTNRSMTPMEILSKHPKGREYAHLLSGRRRFPLIFDSEGVISFPPITNSDRTRVTEQTTDVFIEITGSDKTAANAALNIIMAALETRGGRLESVQIDGWESPDMRPRNVPFDPESIKRMMGESLTNREIKSLLERMGHAVDIKNKTVSVPQYRIDIMHAVDIAEDAAIAYGYNNFVPEMPKHPTIGSLLPIEELSESVREIMIGLGFQEMVNFTLTSKKKLFENMRKREPAIEIENPVTSEYSVCRNWLLPSLLGNLSSNKHRRYPQKIFEVADAVVPDSSETGANNVRKLSAAISHSSAGLSEIISVSNSLFQSLGTKVSLKQESHPTFIRGRCASVILNNRKIGILGEINPEVIISFDLSMPVACLEIELAPLLNLPEPPKNP